MTSFTPYPREMSEARGRDPRFTEAINQNMRIPERLSMGPGQQWGEDEARRRVEDPPPAYSMHIPDRLTYTETPDMSPRPLFTPSKPVLYPPQVLETCWESPSATRDGEAFFRDFPQSPMRRSYSDQGFGRTPPGTPTHTKQTLALHGHPSSSRGSGRPLLQRSGAPPATDPQPVPLPLGLPAIPPSLLSPQAMLQAARQLGQQASQRLLQTVNQKYRFSHHENPTPQAALTDASPHTNVEQARRSVMESWSLEDEGGAAVEFIVLRRQVMKMSRRLAGLERQNTERRNTEVVLFSLLLSACLLNAWLWIRR
ncbi:mitochondrial fission factor-like isoform 2-T2 [Polymixia lowei]